jgi:hypothetical protein
MLRKSLDAFVGAIAESDPNDDFIKHEVPLIRHTLDELEKYINRQQSEMKSDSGAQIYRYVLTRQWQELKEIAQERDASQDESATATVVLLFPTWV